MFILASVGVTCICLPWFYSGLIISLPISQRILTLQVTNLQHLFFELNISGTLIFILLGKFFEGVLILKQVP